MRHIRWKTRLAAASLAAIPVTVEATDLVRASNGAAAIAQPDRALGEDRLVLVMAEGETVALAGLEFRAEAESRALVALSSELLTLAVTHGRIVQGGKTAGAGQALVVTLDGVRTQRLHFDAARLASTLSPGAQALLGEDLAALTRSQRRGRFWGTWQPLRVNARAPVPAALEAARMSYLGNPAIVAQRRAAAGSAEPSARARLAAEAFLTAYAAGDAVRLSGLLDPAPFLARTDAAGLARSRDAAAADLLGDSNLRRTLASARLAAVAEDGSSATLETPSGNWRLSLAPRDRALFVTGLEPQP